MHRIKRPYFLFFVLPTLVAFVIAFFLPFLLGLALSFTEFTTVTDATFVGLKNYIAVFSSGSRFWQAFWFTARFTLVSTLTVNVIAFFLALLLTRGKRGTNFFRTVFFMPNLVGGIVLGYIWQLIINGFLARLGVDITYSATYGFWGLVLLTNWQLIGYMMIIYIAGLQSIPKELHEVASIDGATPFDTLRHIIFPLVAPSVTICVFLTLTNAFKMFDQNFALTGGAPGKETSMLALDIYQTFYGSVGQEGVGQAKAVIFFLLVAAIAGVQLYLSKRREARAE
ncbi:MAG: sugar ABC transporter permease [Clostridia bacterium]|nr:sugar ABC transporter permease [Clostridia bacterium]MBO5755565.1 sugar ABC transporter permease [Clostridia bacterium]